MANIKMAYMGNLVINESVYLCTDMSATLETSPKFFDHTVGLRDIGIGKQKGPAAPGDETVGGKAQTQKRLWRYTPVLYKIAASGPIAGTDDGGSIAWAMLNPAISGKNNTLECVFWHNGVKRRLTEAVISSVSISANAGDVATYTIEAVGKKMVRQSGTTTEASCSKLLTWDRVTFEFAGAEESSGTSVNVSNFSINVNNPILPIYTSGSLKPYALRIGVQEVTGSVSTYGFPPDLTSVTGVIFNLGYGKYTIDAVFTPPQAKADDGPFITTTTFTGAKNGPVWIDVAGTYP